MLKMQNPISTIYYQNLDDLPFVYQIYEWLFRHPNFYKELLKEYRGVCIGKKNYCISVSKVQEEKEFLKQIIPNIPIDFLLQKFNEKTFISEKKGVWLLEREFLKNGIKKLGKSNIILFDYDLYGFDKDDKEKVVLDYIFGTNQFHLLIEKNIDNLYHEALSENYRVPLINELVSFYIENILPPFWRKNIHPLRKLVKQTLNNSLTEKLFLTKISYLSKENIIELVLKYFDEIDPSGNLRSDFLNEIKNGTFLIWNIENEEEAKKIMNILNRNDIQNYYSLYDLETKKHRTNCPLRGNLCDVFSIVHEYFHNYSLDEKQLYFSYSSCLLEEFPSIFFETDVIRFLEKEGFSEEEIITCYNFRNSDFVSLFSQHVFFFNSLEKCHDGKKLTLHDFCGTYDFPINSLEKLLEENKNNEYFKKLIKNLKEERRNAEKIAKETIDSIINTILFDTFKYIRIYKYLIGKVLTDSLMENKENVNAWMLHFSKSLSCLEMDLKDVFKLILKEYQSITLNYSEENTGIHLLPDKNKEYWFTK